MITRKFDFVRKEVEEYYTSFFHKNNEAQICPKIKNKLRTIGARLKGELRV